MNLLITGAGWELGDGMRVRDDERVGQISAVRHLAATGPAANEWTPMPPFCDLAMTSEIAEGNGVADPAVDAEQWLGGVHEQRFVERHVVGGIVWIGIENFGEASEEHARQGYAAATIRR